MSRLLMLASLTALLQTGCAFEAGEDDYYYGVGTLVVDWTLDGTKDAAACRDFGADTVDIVVRTGGSAFLDEFTVYCESFEALVDIETGRYWVDVTLLDVDGFELSTTVTDAVRIYDRELSVSAVDFPVDSLL